MNDTPRTFPIIPTLDLVTPMFQKKPGVLIASMNHEPCAAGAQRIKGFERIDGQTKASEATYYVLEFDAGVATITAGQTVTGATSAATGKALIAMVVESGSFGGGNAAGYLVLTSVTGTFQDNENLQVTAVTKCVANGVAVLEGADNDDDDSDWRELAHETQRALIQKIPGEGSVLGAWMLNGVTYGMRNAVGGATAAIYKTTAAGWSLVALGRRLAFTSGGTYEPQEGDVITGATSGATATLTRISMTSSEDFTTGNAAGWFIFASQTGTFQAENLNVGANLNVATIAGNSAAITIPPGGRYEFVNNNFYGGTATYRMYGCNGVGTAFEFDGTVFVPLPTGSTVDTPTYIGLVENHLLLALPGGGVVTSGIGRPFNYTAAFGASVFGLGSECTGIIGPYSQTTFVLARKHVSVLYGHDSDDFQLIKNSSFSGAIARTGQLVAKPVYYDDAGLRDVTSGQAYGNFQLGTMTRLIEPLIQGKTDAEVFPVASLVCKRKAQYRVFYNDGSLLTVYFGAQSTNPVTGVTSLPQILPQDLGIVATCAYSCEDLNEDGVGIGNEILLMGSEDGYLYQLDSGNNFDGEEIEAYFRPAFDHCGSPEWLKGFSRVGLEGTFLSNINMEYSAEYSYAEANTIPTQEQRVAIAGAGGFWSQDDNWNQFYWSAPYVGKARGRLYGRGENVSVAISTNLTYEDPYIISGMHLHYTLRRLNRMVA